MSGPGRLVGYVALLVTPAALLLSAVRAPPDLSIGFLTVPIGVALAGTVVAETERQRLSRIDAVGLDQTATVDALVVATAAVVTYELSIHAGLGPVRASALIGLVVGLALPQVDGAAYCGSFVGMVSPAVLSSLGGVAIAGTVAGLAFVAATDVFGGFGGKYGALALFGSLTSVALLDADYAVGSTLVWEVVPAIVAVAVVAAVATVVLRTHAGASAVVASAVVGLAAGLMFPIVLPTLGSTLVAVAFCASFVGMSSADRLGTLGQVVWAGLICGLVYVVVTPALAGTGGKLGTTAFVSCLAVAGGLELPTLVRSRVDWSWLDRSQ
ncbi:hypothetical protein HYG81_19540 (plasmid) [Natrinema zhouii]|uniref:hypothetical protein n=1 Tax=Natrinema zhouii TaxID=1710539 RepID=UPI001CFFF2AE|nr:hypothetical protein [Natrinema zhouii]UHQ98270.1 hypothetical protein HYG81_19540 [Natrinema zhouii]